MKTIKNNNGITLVTLIITIAIILILFSVSIAIAIDSDFLGKAQKTVQDTSRKSEIQNKQEENMLDTWENIPGKIVKSGTTP